MAASVGFAGEVKVWKLESKDGDTNSASWEEKGEIIVGARPIPHIVPSEHIHSCTPY
jgi:hypothetical protein